MTNPVLQVQPDEQRRWGDFLPLDNHLVFLRQIMNPLRTNRPVAIHRKALGCQLLVARNPKCPLPIKVTQDLQPHLSRLDPVRERRLIRQLLHLLELRQWLAAAEKLEVIENDGTQGEHQHPGRQEQRQIHVRPPNKPAPCKFFHGLDSAMPNSKLHAP